MKSKITHVIKRTGAVVPFTPDRNTNAIYRAAVAVGGRDRARAEELTGQVVKMLEARTVAGKHPTVEEIQDLVEKVLIENGHAKVAKAYILYREARERRRKKAGRGDRESSNIPWRKIYEVYRWSVRHDLHSVERLNARITNGEFAEIVREAERAYEEDIKSAAQLIVEQRDRLRLVIIAGPSSSGKTTTTIKLGERLARAGLKLVTLNVDNYYFDLHLHPKDEFGDYDFETGPSDIRSQINQHEFGIVYGIKFPFANRKYYLSILFYNALTTLYSRTIPLYKDDFTNKLEMRNNNLSICFDLFF